MKRIAVLGNKMDSKTLSDALDRLTCKLKDFTILYAPANDRPFMFLESWCFARMKPYQIFWEGTEKMIAEADALVVFGAGYNKEVKQAEKRGLKIKRIK